MKSWLQDNNIEMYSIHIEAKSVVAERPNRALKNKLYKYMTSIAKNAYIDKLDDIVKKYNNAYHIITEMKPRDVKPSIYIDFSKEIKNEGPKLKILVRLEYQNIKIFLKKVTLHIVLKEILCLKKLKILYHGHMILVIFTVK